MFLTLQDEAESLIKGIIEMSYFMRGAMTYENILLTMSFAERQLAQQFLNSRLEQELKSPSPNY